MRSVLLASASRYRLELLSDAGLACAVVAPDVDERAEDDRLAELGPRRMALHLAAMKVESVMDRLRSGEVAWPAGLPPNSAILGADQLGLVHTAAGPRQLHKPGTADAAVSQIMATSGHAISLVNGVVLAGLDGTRVEFVDVHRLRVRPVDADLAQRYVTATNPVDCVGGIRIEDCEPNGPWPLLEVVESSGDDGIRGLPISKVERALAAFDALEG